MANRACASRQATVRFLEFRSIAYRERLTEMMMREILLRRSRAVKVRTRADNKTNRLSKMIASLIVRATCCSLDVQGTMRTIVYSNTS